MNLAMCRTKHSLCFRRFQKLFTSGRITYAIYSSEITNTTLGTKSILANVKVRFVQEVSLFSSCVSSPFVQRLHSALRPLDLYFPCSLFSNTRIPVMECHLVKLNHLFLECLSFLTFKKSIISPLSFL